jgi:hypothetical protein
VLLEILYPVRKFLPAIGAVAMAGEADAAMSAVRAATVDSTGATSEWTGKST